LNPSHAATEPSAAARWSIVALLAAALFINYVDRGALPIAGPMVQDELGLSPRQLGLLYSAFFWSYALLQIPVGWLAERFGAQRVLALGLALWASATMLVGFAHSFTVLLLLRLLLGVGESAGFPCVSKLLATVVPVAGLGSANGIVGFAYNFAPAVGAYCGGLLMVQFGWRAAFWVFGALSLLWLLPWSRIKLPARPAGLPAGDGPDLRALLRERALWGTSLAHFASNYTFYFMLTWLPFYLVRERGFSTVGMATLTGSAYVVNALTALFAGWAIDRVSARTGRVSLAYKSVMIAALLGAMVCMLCIGLGTPSWGVAAIFGFQVLMGMSSPGTFAISQILAGPSASGRWVGIQNAIANLAGVVGPALTGVLVEETHHFAAAFVLAALVSVLGVIGWVWMVGKVAPLRWDSSGAAAPLAPLPAMRS
jgi:MFS family permease